MVGQVKSISRTEEVSYDEVGSRGKTITGSMSLIPKCTSWQKVRHLLTRVEGQKLSSDLHTHEVAHTYPHSQAHLPLSRAHTHTHIKDDDDGGGDDKCKTF